MAKLFEQLTSKDGWHRFLKSEPNNLHARPKETFVREVPDEDKANIHFIFKGRALCGISIPAPDKIIRDNVVEEQCNKCFQRHRNLFNSSNVEDAYKDL